MKTYDFQTLCLSICIVIGFLLAFMYGIIWLDHQFKLDDKFASIYSELNKIELEQSKIMPSALKKEPTWTRTKKHSGY